MYSPPTTPVNVNVRKIFFDNLINVLKFVPHDLPKFEKRFSGKELLGFGKYKERTYKEIRQNDKGYCYWVIKQDSKGALERFKYYLQHPNEKREVYKTADYDSDDGNEDIIYRNVNFYYRHNYKYNTIIKVYSLFCTKIIQKQNLIDRETMNRTHLKNEALCKLSTCCGCIKDFIHKNKNYKKKYNALDERDKNHYVVSSDDVHYIKEFIKGKKYPKNYLDRYTIRYPTNWD